MAVKLTQHVNVWLPTKVHGEVPFVKGADPETTVAEALKKLMVPSQIPAYDHIKYIIRDKETSTGKLKTTIKNKKVKTIFFELE